jgi:surface protein
MDNIYQEVYGGVRICIDRDLTLTIAPETDNYTGNAAPGQLPWPNRRHTWPWHSYGDVSCIKRVVIKKGVKAGKSIAGLFKRFKECTEFDLAGLDVADVEDMSEAFYGCGSMTNVAFAASWSTKNVTSMSGTFHACYNLENIDGLSGLDLQNVINMENMFSECWALKHSSAFRTWDTGNVLYMRCMFMECHALEDTVGFSRWNTEKVQDVSYMFSNCYSLPDLDGFSEWNVKNVNTMKETFCCCTSLENAKGIEKWRAPGLTNMSKLFYKCTSLKNVDIFRDWDTQNIITAAYAFEGCGCDYQNVLPSPCPEKGKFKGWRKCVLELCGEPGKWEILAELLIPGDAKRSSYGASEKSVCRTDKARVLAFYAIDGAPLPRVIEACSSYSNPVTYRKGEYILADDFPADRFKKHAEGISFYMSRDAAASSCIY